MYTKSLLIVYGFVLDETHVMYIYTHMHIYIMLVVSFEAFF